MSEPITYWLDIDLLDSDFSVFGGPTGVELKLDRDIWTKLGRPAHITIQPLASRRGGL